jgi:hypothetical protein
MGSMQNLAGPFVELLKYGAALVSVVTVLAKIWVSRLRFRQSRLDEPRCSPLLSAVKVSSK